MDSRAPLYHIAANPRIAAVCAVVLVLLLQAAVGGAVGDTPVTPTDSDGGSSTGP